MTTVTNALRVKNLVKKYKGFQLDIDELHIPKGFTTTLVGENGAGKTTLLKVLAGISPDYKGELTYFNTVVDSVTPEIKEELGFTGGRDYYMPHWNIKQIKELSKLMFDDFDEEKFINLCKDLKVGGEDFEDASKKRCVKFSDGNYTKLMLANVFARTPKLLLLDEPTSPLDPLMREKLNDMIQEYLDQGNGENSVLISTHNIKDIEVITDYVVVLHNGKVLKQAFVEDLKEQYLSVSGTIEQLEMIKDSLYTYRKSSLGFNGIVESSNLEELVANNIETNQATLDEIVVAIMKKHTSLSV